METRQERYRRRTLFKAGWFETLDARRVRNMRWQIRDLHRRESVTPEQAALFPFFLSHPLAQQMFEIEQEDGVWVGYGREFEATLALVAFRSVSSAPAAFQYLANSGSGVAQEDAQFREVQETVALLKDLGLWVVE